MFNISTSKSQSYTDKSFPDIGDENEHFNFWYVDEETNKPIQEQMPVFIALNGLISTHCRSAGAVSGPHNLIHQHWLDEFDEAIWIGIDIFWDKRFCYNSMTGKISSAQFDHQTCHEFALTESSHAGGLYNFQLSAISGGGVYNLDNAFSDDLVSVSPGNVEADDILRYVDHSTFVDIAYEGDPWLIEWCWLLSGVYWSIPEVVDADPYDTPINCGDPDTTKTIDNQNWTWDQDYRTNPTIVSEP